MADSHRFTGIFSISSICGLLILAVPLEARSARPADDPILDCTYPGGGDRDGAFSNFIVPPENQNGNYGGADVNGGISDDCNGNGIPDSEEVGPPLLEEARDSRDFQRGRQGARCIPTPADRNGNCIPSTTIFRGGAKDEQEKHLNHCSYNLQHF